MEWRDLTVLALSITILQNADINRTIEANRSRTQRCRTNW